MWGSHALIAGGTQVICTGEVPAASLTPWPGALCWLASHSAEQKRNLRTALAACGVTSVGMVVVEGQRWLLPGWEVNDADGWDSQQISLWWLRMGWNHSAGALWFCTSSQSRW